MFSTAVINNGNKIGIRHGSLLDFVRQALLFGCAFLAPYGSGLQNIAGFDIAKLFPLCAVGLIMYWLVFKRRRFDAFPHTFNLFLLYTIIHTCIVYGIFYREEFAFGYTIAAITTDGFVIAHDLLGNIVVKFFLFAGFAYATASLLRNKRELVRLSLFYAFGIFTSFILGTHVDDSVGSVVRSTGGFLNPNSLGFSAMVATFLSLSVVRCHEANRMEKNIAIGLLIFSLYALVKSVARSSILSTGFGLIVMIVLEPMNKKIRMIAILCVVGASLTIFLPSIVSESVQERFNPDYIKSTEYGMRLPIFIDYLNQWPSYIVQGVGYGRAIEVTKRSYMTRELWIPHNTYLVVLVEFGSLGLLLFLSLMWSLWRRIIPSKQARFRLSAGTAYAGLLAACAIFFFVGTYATREFWLCWAILAVYGRWTVQAHIKTSYTKVN
ncbi:MAG: O-antigen ligase family protein [Phycisphaerae bacterium]|jgi:O-antigen ligase